MLLRGVGQLSRSVHSYRENPPDPRSRHRLRRGLGRSETHIAVMPHTGTWSEAGVLAAAKEFRHDLHVVPGRAAAGTPGDRGGGPHNQRGRL